jgi:hypothetical protein
VKSEPEAHLLLGIAQLKAGHKDEAVKSFHAVKGDLALERLANLWSLHAKRALRRLEGEMRQAIKAGNCMPSDALLKNLSVSLDCERGHGVMKRT